MTTSLLSMKNAIARLGVSRKTVLLLIARGKLKALKVGRQWRFEPNDLEAYIERQKAEVITREALPALGRAEAAPAVLRRTTRSAETKWKGADRYLKH